MNETREIPKIIHMIWIGPKNPPLWCIDSWREKYINKYKDWKFMLWTETEIDNLTMINKQIYDSEPTLRGKSDIVRYDILFKYGGIFLDADSYYIEKPNSNLNRLLLIAKNCGFFCANEPKQRHLYANGVFACTKNNSICFKIITYLKQTYFTEKSKNQHKYKIWKVTGPVPFSKIIKENLNKVTVFPSEYFFPESYHKNNRKIELDKLALMFPSSFMYQYWLSHTDEYKE